MLPSLRTKEIKGRDIKVLGCLERLTAHHYLVYCLSAYTVVVVFA